MDLQWEFEVLCLLEDMVKKYFKKEIILSLSAIPNMEEDDK